MKAKIKSNTCIAVIKNEKGKLIMAGDRRISYGNNAAISPRPKVVKTGELLIGSSGNAYICDLITEVLPKFCLHPLIESEQSSFDYMHQTLVPLVTELLEQKKQNLTDHVKFYPEEVYCVALIGLRGEVFELSIESDTGVSIVPVPTPFAIGCGGETALASLHTASDSKLTAKKRLTLAMGIAAELVPGCDNNIDYIYE